MLISKLALPIQQVARSTRRLFQIAVETDLVVTVLYYLTAGIGALIPLASAFVFKLLIDHLQTEQGLAFSTPLVVVAILASFYVVTFIESIVFWAINISYLDYILRYRLQNEITIRFHEKLSTIDMPHLENPGVQDLLSKVRTTMQWRLPDFLRYLSELFRDLVAFAAAFIVVLPFGWWIPIVVSVVAIPRLFLQAKYGSVQWSLWGSGAPQVKKLWYMDSLLQEPQTIRELRITHAKDALLNKFKSIQDHLFKLNKKALDRKVLASTFPPVFEGVVIFIIAYSFLPSTLAGALSVGSFTLLINMLSQLGSRAANASSHFAQLYESNLYADHYFELLALPKVVVESKNPVRFSKIEPPRIEFKDVYFEYPGGHKALEGVSFTIEPGESVAFVGSNGAGKTTIVKLLCRFYDVTKGKILINGVNIKDLDLKNWYKHLGTLFQEFVRYHFSVRENITLGSSRKPDEKLMVEAAKKAGAAEFIEKLPEKYNQILGTEFEEGTDLSGGQWQKLAIARAFYESPPVLILDEPTSAIDAEAEYEIFSNLENQYVDKTLILVSHRFSTVRNADKIIVIDAGKVVEIGNHEELMKQKKQYAKLFSIQAKGYR